MKGKGSKAAERLAASGVDGSGPSSAAVSVVEAARRSIDAAVGGFGRLDVLVANAGVIPLNNS